MRNTSGNIAGFKEVYDSQVFFPLLIIILKLKAEHPLVIYLKVHTLQRSLMSETLNIQSKLMSSFSIISYKYKNIQNNNEQKNMF